MKQQGFILLVTLIMMSVMGLLLLGAMHQLQLVLHSSRERELAHQEFYQLEHLLRKRMSSSFKKTTCVFPQQDINWAWAELMQKKGCQLTGAAKEYYYLMEDLGDYPCLIVVDGKKKQATHHYRLAVASVSKNEKLALLQIRFIEPAISASQCQKGTHQVQPGISSWRYVVPKKLMV